MRGLLGETRPLALLAILWGEVQLHAPSVVQNGLIAAPPFHLDGHPPIAEFHHLSPLAGKRPDGNLYDLLGPLDAWKGVQGEAAGIAAGGRVRRSGNLPVLAARCRRRGCLSPSSVSVSFPRRRCWGVGPTAGVCAEAASPGWPGGVVVGVDGAVPRPGDGNEGAGPPPGGGGPASGLGRVAVGEASILGAAHCRCWHPRSAGRCRRCR